MMEDRYYYRHFLICNKMANDLLNMLPQNFAKLIIEEGNGRYANSQMTQIFNAFDRSLSDLIGNDEGFMWDELDMQEMAEIPVDVLEAHYEEFCQGKTRLTNSDDKR